MSFRTTILAVTACAALFLTPSISNAQFAAGGVGVDTSGYTYPNYSTSYYQPTTPSPVDYYRSPSPIQQSYYYGNSSTTGRSSKRVSRERTSNRSSAYYQQAPSRYSYPNNYSGYSYPSNYYSNYSYSSPAYGYSSSGAGININLGY